jgi:hypothetical protein
MTRYRQYRRRKPKLALRIRQNRYFRIVSIIVIIVAVASFYIYQRVWVRNLVAENKLLEARNGRTLEHLAALKSDWMAASSISNVEILVAELHLQLEPTSPTQNFTLRPDESCRRSRYAGLVKALEKLKGNIPLVSPNEADAGVLFKGK